MKKIFGFLILIIVLATACSVRTVNNLPGTNEVIIDAAHQNCNADEDCISVQTKCNGCECGGIPANKEYKQMYANKYNELCKDYQGPQCDVMCVLGSVKCINNKCTFVEEGALEKDIDNCTQDNECILVDYSHCCGATKRAINQKYLANYNKHPEWQKFDDPDICQKIGICRDDSNATKAQCKENKCVKIY